MASLQSISVFIAASALALLLAIFLSKYHSQFRFFKHHDFDDVATISFDKLHEEQYILDDLLLKSMTEFGFFYVEGVPNYNSSDELRLLQQFFNLPEANKMELAVKKHNSLNKNVYRGYGPVVENSGTQYKEMYNIGPHEEDPTASCEDLTMLERVKLISKEKNRWPETEDLNFNAEFRRIFKKGFDIRWSIASSVIRSFGRSLGHPDLIGRFQESEFSTLGLRKYPVRTSENEAMNSVYDGVTLSELEHEDSTVTVLSTFSNPGLQALYKGRYLDVPPSYNGFIVNIGTLVSEVTDSRLKAVRHRVMNVGKTRYSIPFFFNPSFDADISRSISGHTTTAGKAGYSIFGEWMMDYLPSVEPSLLLNKLAR